MRGEKDLKVLTDILLDVYRGRPIVHMTWRTIITSITMVISFSLYPSMKKLQHVHASDVTCRVRGKGAHSHSHHRVRIRPLN